MDLLLSAACATVIASLGAAPAPMFSSPVDDPSLCAVLSLDLAARYGGTFPKVGVHRGFSLPRSHIVLGLDLGGIAWARIELAATRSGGATGYIGVDGEALLPALRLAEAGATWRQAGLDFRAGLIADPWVEGADSAWSFRPVAASFAEVSGWFARSDLGAAVLWTPPRSFATLRFDFTSGEGLNRRERNNGFDSTITASFRPLALAPSPKPRLLRIDLLAREGSRGPSSARDHRGALRVSAELGIVQLGIEGIMAFGVDGDAAREAQALSIFAGLRGIPRLPLLLYGRLDLNTEDIENKDAGALTLRVGAGVDLPPTRTGRPFEVLVGYELRDRGAMVRSLARAPGLARSHSLFVQIGVRLRGAGRIAALPILSPHPDRP